MLLLALAVAVGSMHGTITFEGYPLPGVTVKVMSGSFFASRIANATGSYAFDEVPPGSYDLTFELTGFATEKRIASVDAGNSAQTDVDIIAWAHGTCRPPERFDGAVMEALRKLDYVRIAK